MKNKQPKLKTRKEMLDKAKVPAVKKAEVKAIVDKSKRLRSQPKDK